MGKETVIQLAHHKPSRIYMGARNEEKARAAIASIQAELPSPADIRCIQLDLASLESIQTAVKKFTVDSDRLDLLILNAGVMGNDATTTKEGFEIQFGTNHIGHFLLTKLLLPTLERTRKEDNTDVRIVAVASLANMMAPSFETMTSTKALLEASTWTRYGASKAANILFAAELARRFPSLLSVSIHPGIVSSGLYDTNAATREQRGAIERIGRSIRTGALTQLWASGVKKELLSNGAYYTPIGVPATRNKFVSDKEEAKKLWEWTDEQIAKKLGGT